jgi:hypothetical protein
VQCRGQLHLEFIPEILPFEGRWPLKGVGGVTLLAEEIPQFATFPDSLTPLRRARARHLPSKGRISFQRRLPGMQRVVLLTRRFEMVLQQSNLATWGRGHVSDFQGQFWNGIAQLIRLILFWMWGALTFRTGLSKRAPVLAPLFRRAFKQVHVDVGIIAVRDRRLADYDKHAVRSAFVDQMMRIAVALGISDAVTRQDRGAAVVVHQHRRTRDHHQKFILTGVPVALSRPGSGLERDVADPEIRDPCGGGKATVPAALHFAGVLRRIARRVDLRDSFEIHFGHKATFALRGQEARAP